MKFWTRNEKPEREKTFEEIAIASAKQRGKEFAARCAVKEKLEKEKAAREQKRAKQEAKILKIKPAEKADCHACLETGKWKKMTVLPCCQSTYCKACMIRELTSPRTSFWNLTLIIDAFRLASKDEIPFRCCGIAIPIKPYKFSLGLRFLKNYALLLEESNTSHPRYCQGLHCGKFIPPKRVKLNVGKCIHCRKVSNYGTTYDSPEQRSLLLLARGKGWQQCPNCSQIIEKTQGCPAMRCKCGVFFCYACGRHYDECFRKKCKVAMRIAGEWET